MKKILIQFHPYGEGELFNLGGAELTVCLKGRLKQLGYQLGTADNKRIEDCLWIWFWNFSEEYKTKSPMLRIIRALKHVLKSKRQQAERHNLYEECISAGMQDRIGLFIWEPPVTHRPNWNPNVHDLFSTILTWNDNYVDHKKFHKFCFPVTSYFPVVPEISYKNKKLLVNISGNKFSSYPRELYSARRETIRYFERKQPDQFDVYGIGWDNLKKGQRSYPSYRGPVKHKWDVYPSYRFGLCYENMRDEPGYITEKIFDCMRAGCVPIYWGASNITDYVNADAFIDRRRFKSDPELESFLVSVTESEYEKYRQAIKAYLASDRFAAFLPPAFADTITRVFQL
jgi:hypothetical protein